MKYLIILVVLLSGCASLDGGKSAEDSLNAAYYSGRIGELEYAQTALENTLKYQPEAYGLHAFLQDRVILASALDRKEITKAQFSSALAKRSREYNMMSQQYANQGMNPLAAMMMMNMFNNSIQRNFPRPVHCASYQLAGATHSDCY